MFSTKLEYIRENNVSQTMEHILRRMLIDMPDKPLEYIHELTKSPVPPQFIIAGPPGSGKEAQCQALIKRYKLVLISSGELLRKEVSAGTDFGKLAEPYMKNGELVPNKLVMAVIRSRLEQDDVKEHGFLLEGFPRSIEQAELLEAEGITPHAVIILDVSDDEVIKRIEHRRTDPATGTVYHLLFNPPPDDDAALWDRLVQRAEDFRPAVEMKLKTYHDIIKQLKTYYGPLVEIVDGEQNIKNIRKAVLAVAERRRLK